MKICMLSDSHGRKKLAFDLLYEHKYDYVFYLGDGLKDVEDFEEDNFIKVCGNCDIFEVAPITRTVTIEGVKFLLTHGHAFKAKYSDYGLIKVAQDMGANVVCFGHTHKQKHEVLEGITLINAGAFKNGDYAELTVENGKIKKVEFKEI